MNDMPILGQDAVVPMFGLGRIINITDDYVSVKSYVTGQVCNFDLCNVRLIKLNYVE